MVRIVLRRAGRVKAIVLMARLPLWVDTSRRFTYRTPTPALCANHVAPPTGREVLRLQKVGGMIRRIETDRPLGGADERELAVLTRSDSLWAAAWREQTGGVTEAAAGSAATSFDETMFWNAPFFAMAHRKLGRRAEAMQALERARSPLRDSGLLSVDEAVELRG